MEIDVVCELPSMGHVYLQANKHNRRTEHTYAVETRHLMQLGHFFQRIKGNIKRPWQGE